MPQTVQLAAAPHLAQPRPSASDTKPSGWKPMRSFALYCLTCFCLCLSLGSTLTQAQTLDQIIAVVEETVILGSELDSRVDLIVRQVGNNQNQLPPIDILRAQVLDRMITETVQLQLAERLGLRIRDEDVTEAMTRVAARNKQSLQQLRKTLLARKTDFGEFREQIKRELIISRVQQRLVSQRIQVTDQDVKNFLASPIGKEQLSAEYRLFHLLVAVDENPSNADLAKAKQSVSRLKSRIESGRMSFKNAALTYSDGQNAEQGGDMGWRRLGQLPTLFAEAVKQLPAGALSEPIQSGAGFHLLFVAERRGGISKNVDQTQVRHILVAPNTIRSEQQTQSLIESIYQQIRQGTSFAELAKTYSDDTSTARNGGDLGWINPSTMVPAFEKVVRAQSTGKVSKPFRSRYGWHVLEVLGRRNQDMSEAYKMATAKQMIFRRKFDEELDSWLREVRQDAFVEIRL